MELGYIPFIVISIDAMLAALRIREGRNSPIGILHALLCSDDVRASAQKQVHPDSAKPDAMTEA